MQIEKRILITGFEAFGDQAINPTQRLVASLRDEASSAGGTLPYLSSNVVAETVILPVTFAESYQQLKDVVDDFNPHAIVSLGQAGGRKTIDLERVAINCLDAEIPDNKGFQPRDEFITDDGQAAYFSTLPLRRLLEALRANEIPAQISNTAGTYVCNALLYRVLEADASSFSTASRQSGFIHFPYLPVQTVGRDGVPSLPFETMKRALEVILATVSESIAGD